MQNKQMEIKKKYTFSKFRGLMSENDPFSLISRIRASHRK